MMNSSGHVSDCCLEGSAGDCIKRELTMKELPFTLNFHTLEYAMNNLKKAVFKKSKYDC